jgi:hypothetical protein
MSGEVVTPDDGPPTSLEVRFKKLKGALSEIYSRSSENPPAAGTDAYIAMQALQVDKTLELELMEWIAKRTNG